RMQQDDRDGKERDRAELEEGGEIIAWREQQPDRQDGGDPTIPDHEAGERQTRPVEESAQQRMSIDPSSGQHRQEHQRDAQSRSLEDPSRTQLPQMRS